MFVERWSRRAFAARPLPAGTAASLFEAARWAPSSSNTQPWLFLYADDDESLARARPLLFDSNRRWADKAPLLVFVFARKLHARTGEPLRTGAFDTGSAWMSLALQAHALGLVTHAMGGVHHAQTYDVFGVPRDAYESMAAIAIGYPGDPADLPEDLRARETPNGRKPSAEVAMRGRYRAP